MKIGFHNTIPALAALFLTAGCAAPSQPDEPKPSISKENNVDVNLIEKVSRHTFDETVARLRGAIEKRPLKLFSEIDHAKGAASADLTLAPSTLFIFGNPKGGTPLMTRNAKMGIALPLKMHVYQDGDKVLVSYFDMTALVQSYGLDASEQPVPNIAGLLDGLASEAAGE